MPTSLLFHLFTSSLPRTSVSPVPSCASHSQELPDLNCIKALTSPGSLGAQFSPLAHQGLSLHPSRGGRLVASPSLSPAPLPAAHESPHETASQSLRRPARIARVFSCSSHCKPVNWKIAPIFRPRHSSPRKAEWLPRVTQSTGAVNQTT